MTRVYTRRNPAERFWAFVQKTDGCWLWNGPKRRRGYGEFRPDWQGKNWPAHRYAFFLAHGREPRHDSVVCHRCDNPSCVRPDHLFEGTQADNIQDCVTKGRHHFASVTHCPKGHEYTPENTRDKGGQNGGRGCRQCHRDQERVRRLRLARSH